MKKFVVPFIFILCICITLCSCYSSDDDYSYLEREYENSQEEINSLEEQILNNEICLEHAIKYIKEIDEINSIATYQFRDTWSVEDFFDFSLYCEKERDAVYCSIKTKEGYPINFIWDETSGLQNLFMATYRSDGLFETYNVSGSEDIILFVPEYNYSYEILLFATVNNKVYRANYNFSVEDIK